MNKKSFTNIILASAIVFSFGGISQVYAVPAAPNKTSIIAEILSVQQINSSSNFASNYVKILEIKVIEKKSVEGSFNVPSELKAYVHKWTNDLTIVNKLEKGQTITAAILYSGDERGGMWDVREIKISTPTQTQCEIGKIYDNTAVSPVSCSCPVGYQFETVEIGWGPCPSAGMSDCPATKLKCVTKPVSTNTNEPLPTSTQTPTKIEVTATETTISGPQPTTAKLPVGCVQSGETTTCPTSKTKPVAIPVATATNEPLEVVTIQKQVDGTIGITSNKATAITTEKVTVEENRLFVGPTESAKPVSVLPHEAQNTAISSAGIASVVATELKTEEQKPVYTIQGIRNSRLLFFIPVSVKTTTKIDASNGKVISIQKPWWSFLTR